MVEVEAFEEDEAVDEDDEEEVKIEEVVAPYQFWVAVDL